VLYKYLNNLAVMPPPHPFREEPMVIKNFICISHFINNLPEKFESEDLFCLQMPQENREKLQTRKPALQIYTFT